jgi:hypothetical protein
VRRYVESNNVVILAVLLEFQRLVALIAVDNKQIVGPNSTPL